MRRYAPLGAVLLSMTAGCLVPFNRIPKLPPPPSEEVRAEFGRIGFSASMEAPLFEAQAPARGWCEGAWRGSVWAMVSCFSAGGSSGDAYGAAAGLALAPFAGIIGAIVGGVAAPSAEDVDRAEADLMAAFNELDLQANFRDRVFRIAHRETSEKLCPIGHPPEGIDTLLETGVCKVGLRGPWSINPDLGLEVVVEARILKMPSREVLHVLTLTSWGRPREFADWGAGGGAAFRKEIERALEECASRIVEESFLLYLPKVSPEGGY